MNTKSKNTPLAPGLTCLGDRTSAQSLTLSHTRTKDHSLYLTVGKSTVRVARILGASIPNADVPAQHYAARIVACVNACEGIEDPSVVPQLLNFVRETLANQQHDGKPIEWSESYMMALIDCAEGKKQ